MNNGCQQKVRFYMQMYSYIVDINVPVPNLIWSIIMPSECISGYLILYKYQLL